MVLRSATHDPLLVLTFAAISCGGGNGDTQSVTGPLSDSPPAAVAISPNSPAIYVSQKIQLRAVTVDVAGNVSPGPSVKWSITDPRVATVSVTGLVSGVANGFTVITATSGTLSGTTILTVNTNSQTEWTIGGPLSVPRVLLPSGSHRADVNTILLRREGK